MNDIFGIGLPELAVILIIAGVVMGPQRVAEVARWLGRFTAQMQDISRQLARQLNAELAALDDGGDVRGALDEVQALRKQVAELRQEVTAVSTGTVREGKEAIDDTRAALENALDGATPRQQKNGAADSLPTPLDVPDDPE